MISVRRSEDRGHNNLGWLDAKHTFSFGAYQDPNFTGFRDLLVINQDTIEPLQGFGAHPHKDMEIITYVFEGGIEHQDSIGNRGVISTGEIQRMSAGSGIVHSEVNPLTDKKTQLLQIWIQTAQKGIDPDYENVKFEKKPGLNLLVSPEGGEHVAKINQDFKMYGGYLSEDKFAEHKLEKGRAAWIQLVKGELEVNGEKIKAGDGLAITEEESLRFTTASHAEFLLMDLR